MSILTHTVIVEQKHDDQDEALVCDPDVQANDKHQHVVDPTEGGALWDVFRRHDISKLEEYLRNHSAEFSSVEVVFYLEKVDVCMCYITPYSYCFT